jgi:hypothetical protein
MKSFSKFSSSNFDKKTGLAKGVSVISIGPALGHGVNIDHKTLETVLAAAKKHPDGVKVHLQHDSDLKDVVGFLSNFAIEANRLRADLKLLRMSPWYGYLAELIDNHSSEFGLSISSNGTEEDKGGSTFYRVTDLFSVDLVSDPAANASGLFSSNVINKRARMDKDQTDATATKDVDLSADENDDLAKRISILEQALEDLKAEQAKMAEGDEDDGDDAEDDQGEDDDEESEDDESDNSEDYKALEAKLASALKTIDDLKANTANAEKLAARKLGKTGVKNNKVKVTANSAPSIEQQFDALTSHNERVAFYRKNKQALNEYRQREFARIVLKRG